MRRGAAALTATVALAGCGGSSGEPAPPRSDDAAAPAPDHAVPPRPRAAGPELTESAPRWVQEFCAEARRRGGLRCPATVPAGFERPSLPQEQPTRRAYRLVGTADTMWVISGRRRRGRSIRLAKPQRGVGGGLVLRWTLGRGLYTLRAEAANDPMLEAQMIYVARSFGRD